MNRNLRLLSAALVIALAPVAYAQTAGEVDTQVSSLDSTTANRGQTHVATRIATSFASLAGSQDNSLALVNALRNGTSVTLAPPAGTTTGTGTASTGTTITPPTGKMGWGEVFISLALAKSELASQGITNPTADQLNAALTGGTITKADGTTVTVKGVLEMRADGMGWGQIAKAEGTKLGPVVSSMKSERVKMASLPPSTTTPPVTSTASTKSASTEVEHSGKSHKGIVTATGSTATEVEHSGKSHKGIVTATGSTATEVEHSGKSHKGIVTATGSIPTAGAGHGSGSGRGLVTAAGGSAGGLSTAGMHGSGHGAGVVTAAGGTSATGVTTAQGGGHGDNGSAHGKGKGGG